MKRAKAVPFVVGLFSDLMADELFDLLVKAGLNPGRLWTLYQEHQAKAEKAQTEHARSE